MNRLITLMTFTFLTGGSYTARTQDAVKQAEDKDSKRDAKAYAIQSVEGKNSVIHVMPIYFGHVLKISYLKDTIAIKDFWGVPADVTVLGKTFLEIDYAIRGGSGVGVGNTLVLCVSQNHLHKCMYVMKYLTGESADEQSDYNIRLLLTGKKSHDFKLNVTIRDKQFSKSHPEENYNYKNLSILSFDVKNSVFYSVKKDFYDEFLIDNGAGKTSRQKLHNDYPEIILGKETYFYINNNWYTLDDGKKLYPVASDTY